MHYFPANMALASLFFDITTERYFRIQYELSLSALKFNRSINYEEERESHTHGTAFSLV